MLGLIEWIVLFLVLMELTLSVGPAKPAACKKRGCKIPGRRRRGPRWRPEGPSGEAGLKKGWELPIHNLNTAVRLESSGWRPKLARYVGGVRE